MNNLNDMMAVVQGFEHVNEVQPCFSRVNPDEEAILGTTVSDAF